MLKFIFIGLLFAHSAFATLTFSSHGQSPIASIDLNFHPLENGIETVITFHIEHIDENTNSERLGDFLFRRLSATQGDNLLTWLGQFVAPNSTTLNITLRAINSEMTSSYLNTILNLLVGVPGGRGWILFFPNNIQKELKDIEEEDHLIRSLSQTSISESQSQNASRSNSQGTFSYQETVVMDTVIFSDASTNSGCSLGSH